MTCSLAIIRRVNDLCIERNITINKLATLSGLVLCQEIGQPKCSF